MKFSSILMSAVIASAAQAASSVPSGTFLGTGHWKGPGGSTGAYSVETTVKDRVLTSRYEFNEGGQARLESVVVKMATKGEPFFDVLDERDQVVGNGFCYDAECSYHAEFSGVVVEETLRFSKGSLEKLGTKKGPGFSVVWKEVLEAK